MEALRSKRGRRAQYNSAEFERALRLVWKHMDYMGSKLMVRALPDWLPYIEKHHGAFSTEVRHKLLSISAATIDRQLKSVRTSVRAKVHTLRPVRTAASPQRPVLEEIKANPAGVCEAHLIAHNGGLASGESINSVVLTDTCTEWSYLCAQWGNSEVKRAAAITALKKQFPFPVREVRLSWECAGPNQSSQQRPYRSAWAWNGKFTHIRELLGTERFEQPVLADTLNALYQDYCLYRNHFIPTIQTGRTSTRKFTSRPATPYQRVLASVQVSEKDKALLTVNHSLLDPVELRRRVEQQLRSFFDQLRELRNGEIFRKTA